jgi:phage-related baseplate assembly protein
MSDELENTMFELPLSPDEFSVMLPPAKLRRIDFSALDFDTSRRAIIEYIRTYYPNDFNDWVAHSGIMMLIETQANNVAKLSLRSDLLSNEAFLPTCQTEAALIEHLALINQTVKPQTPAVVDIEVSVQTALTISLDIDAGARFTITGPDGQPLYYELFRAPGDFTSTITIPAGKRGVIGYGIEGRFAGPAKLYSPGGPNQTYTIKASNILQEPITVDVYTGDTSTSWRVTTDPLETYDADAEVVNVTFYTDRIELLFGDDINGKAPLAGQEIDVNYRVGGGVRGRIGSYAINESRSILPSSPSSATAPVQVTFRNLVSSSGGTDRETLEQAKKRAPRDFAVRAFASDRPASITTASDYAQVISSFSSPVYGSVAKAVATIRTDLNANLVELYILAYGEDGLVTPSLGLKQAVSTYVDEYNVLTDTVSVLDGAIKSISIDMTVVVNRNADASVVRTNVNAALDDFFNVNNRDLGQPLYVSDIIEAASNVDGVSYVDLFDPANNILQTNQLADPEDKTGVGINEIIVEGSRNVKFFYEKSRI